MHRVVQTIDAAKPFHNINFGAIASAVSDVGSAGGEEPKGGPPSCFAGQAGASFKLTISLLEQALGRGHADREIIGIIIAVTVFYAVHG